MRRFKVSPVVRMSMQYNETIVWCENTIQSYVWVPFTTRSHRYHRDAKQGLVTNQASPFYCCYQYKEKIGTYMASGYLMTL